MRNQRRGVTLLEVMMSIVIATVIFGIAMSVLVTTNRSAKKTIADGTLLQQAQVAMRQVRAILEGTAWPEDLEPLIEGEPLFVFNQDDVRLISTYEPTDTGGFCQYSFNTKTAEDGTPPQAGYSRREPAAPADATVFQKIGGEFETALEFRFASEIGEGIKPVWKDALAAGEKPQLIWVRVTLRDPKTKDREGKPEEVRLETAIAL